MKTIHDLRHANLESLVGAAKSQREFADRVDLAPAYVSQMLLKRRGIGERTARKIEAAMRLPMGWMDQDRDAYPPVPDINSPNHLVSSGKTGWKDADRRAASVNTGSQGAHIAATDATLKADLPPPSLPLGFEAIIALLPNSTPRSRTALERIAEAHRDGRLTEADLELLDHIAERIASRKEP